MDEGLSFGRVGIILLVILVIVALVVLLLSGGDVRVLLQLVGVPATCGAPPPNAQFAAEVNADTPCAPDNCDSFCFVGRDTFSCEFCSPCGPAPPKKQFRVIPWSGLKATEDTLCAEDVSATECAAFCFEDAVCGEPQEGMVFAKNAMAELPIDDDTDETRLRTCFRFTCGPRPRDTVALAGLLSVTSEGARGCTELEDKPDEAFGRYCDGFYEERTSDSVVARCRPPTGNGKVCSKETIGVATKYKYRPGKDADAPYDGPFDQRSSEANTECFERIFRSGPAPASTNLAFQLGKT